MNSEELVKKLCAAREHIYQLSGLFNIIEQYRKTAADAKENINSVLYELTGEDFYRSKK